MNDAPTPSVWPFALALGIALLFFGIVSSLIFSVAGLVAIVAALAGWIRELLHE